MEQKLEECEQALLEEEKLMMDIVQLQHKCEEEIIEKQRKLTIYQDLLDRTKTSIFKKKEIMDDIEHMIDLLRDKAAVIDLLEKRQTDREIERPAEQ